MSQNGDINDYSAVAAAMRSSQADVLIHLAAQPLVLASYSDPIGTFETNVLGTAKVLAAAREAPALKAAVIVTSDKVYQNSEWPWPYRENDTLGGADPYSASKAAAEIVTRSMAMSYFPGHSGPQVVTARSGNVIGGGDWAEHRLLPDAARALSRGEPLVCRNPDSVRPWQHVLDPLLGYLLLAQTIASSDVPLQSAWNFGPSQEDALRVRDVADIFTRNWSSSARWITSDRSPETKEAGRLTIDSSLARGQLGWRPHWSAREAVERTARWYHAHAQGADANMLVEQEIADFTAVEGATT